MATLTLTPYSDMGPVPRINLRVDGTSEFADSVNVYAATTTGRRLVRGLRPHDAA